MIWTHDPKGSNRQGRGEQKAKTGKVNLERPRIRTSQKFWKEKERHGGKLYRWPQTKRNREGL